jgi:hypothetical protein
MEQIRIDSTAPMNQILKATRVEFVSHRRRADHTSLACRVEPAQRKKRDRQRNRHSCTNIVGKLRMVGGGEVKSLA